MAQTQKRKSPTLTEILQAFRNDPKFRNNITHWHTLPANPGIFADFPTALSPELVAILKQRGITRLFSHQVEAIEHILAGENVVIVTFPASGKSLCYNIPTVEAILKNPESRALYLFPTKALSQDQYAELYNITAALERGIKIYTFDGDTPQSARKAIRIAGQIVVTNPDMLHTGILPHHTLWIRLFENLRYVVIDEVHHYRGVFGSHFANLIRRLKRICAFYGAKPQFICCSATIDNPLELSQKLVEESFHLVDKSGAPQGEKAFVFYNPPLVNPELGIRKSVVSETRRIAARFITAGIQTITFARSRLRVEILVTYLKRTMKRLRRNPDLVRGYRGGYLPNERREIEQGIKSGAILGVVSTNALELGIDIGRLKVAVLAGYPGSVASTWQQSGRAGRKTDASAAILVASSLPLDQYIINHPSYFFGLPPEMGIINPNNMPILASHMKCAAFELPFQDAEQFGAVDPLPLLQYLEEKNILRHAGGRWFWQSDSYPAEEISLRSATVENFVVLDTSQQNKVIAEVDYDSAPYLIHEDAIYIHQSQPYFIERLDWDGRTAFAKPSKVDYYTDAQAKTNIEVLTVDHSFSHNPDAIPLHSKNFGTVSVVTVVAKYKKIKFETQENVGYGEIHLPQHEMQTESYWLTFRDDLREKLNLSGEDLAGALQALATLLANVVPLFVMCDPKDFYTLAMLRSPYDERPAIYIYDRYPGGIGISQRIFSIDRDIFKAALEIVRKCPCSHGCPSCVGPSMEVGMQGKSIAQRLLDRILS